MLRRIGRIFHHIPPHRAARLLRSGIHIVGHHRIKIATERIESAPKRQPARGDHVGDQFGAGLNFGKIFDVPLPVDHRVPSQRQRTPAGRAGGTANVGCN